MDTLAEMYTLALLLIVEGALDMTTVGAEVATTNTETVVWSTRLPLVTVKVNTVVVPLVPAPAYTRTIANLISHLLMFGEYKILYFFAYQTQ